ncbi:DUF4352 domain-containing protein [Spirillospora sp. CA-253888]
MIKRPMILAAIAALTLPLAAACETGTEPTAVQGADKGNKTSAAKGKAAKPVTVKLAAKRTPFKPSVLHSGEKLSCVKVVVTNQRKGKNLAVNPMYFSLVDTAGEKHEAADALGSYEDQIDTTTLAPNEKATGVVCGKGKFTPKIVAMTNELLQESARAQVA